MAALTVAAIIAVPYMGERSESSAPSAKLPMGLLLESSKGELRIVNTQKDSALFGLQPGDLIQQVDGKPVNSLASFEGILQSKTRGDSMQMVVKRGDALVTISRKYSGPLSMEVPVSEIEMASNVTPTALNDTPTTGQPRVINPVWADFGLTFNEGEGRLIVESVDDQRAGGAYGIQPQDIVFQIDTRKITSLSDFHGLAAEKLDGDSANVMLVRDENIVIIRDMQLGSSSRPIAAPVDFQPEIYPFASLEKSSLERLLDDPFSFVPDAVAKTEPVQEALIANVAEVAADAAEVLTEFDLSAQESGAIPGYAQTTPLGPEIAEVASSLLDLGGTSQVRRFSDLDEVKTLAADARNLVKPNAVPRFNKYSDITLPQNQYGKQIAKAASGTQDVVNNVVKTADEVIDSVIGDKAINPIVSGTEGDVATMVDPTPGTIAEANPTQSSGQVLSSTPAKSSSFTTGSSVAQHANVHPPTPPIDNPYIQTTTPATKAADVKASAPTARRVSTPVKEVVGEKVNVITEPNYTSKFAATQAAGETAPDVAGAVVEAAETAAQTASDDPAPVESTTVVESSPVVEGTVVDGTVMSQSATPVEVYSPAGTVMAAPAPMMQGMACQQCPPSPYPCATQPQCGCYRCMLSNLTDFNLNQALYGCDTPAVSLGGWFQLGYHSESNDLFNSRPDNLALHQGWLFIEKGVSENGDWGFRGDIMYGIDADDTQAFGNTPGRWDFQNGFDNGSYGWAIPQLYANVMMGGWDIKIGHFYTLIGYEVVTAPDNFFYSHAITMYNSEPFTHTGVMASKDINDKTTLYAGYTLGWDTGFDQFNDGSSWLGGISYAFTDRASITYMSTAGNFGARGDDAYSHSIVMSVQVTDNFEWIGQSDMVRVDSTGEDNFGLNQYFLYSATDRLGLGARVEWWKGDVLTGYAPHGGVLPAAGSLSYYAATFGVNYKPKSNVVVRPEVRFDWSPAADYDEAYFGVDAIMSF